MSIRTGLIRLAGVTRDVFFALSSKTRLDRWNRNVRKVYPRSYEGLNSQKQLSRFDLFTSKFDPFKQATRDRWTGRVFQRRTALFSFLGISFMSYGQKEASLLDSVKGILLTIQPLSEKKTCDQLKPDDIELGPFIANGCFGAVFQARAKATQDYSLAVKVVFNRDAGSTSAEIMEKLGKEALVERSLFTRGNFRSILSHQNVIQVKSIFVHEAKRLSKLTMPARIKTRINARSRTLFLVMERCDTTLHAFLRGSDPISFKVRTLLFAQLLEAIAYLNEKGIAHRDLKTDNILLKFVQGPCPRLVVTDFGLAYVSKLMFLHYSSDQVCRGGNRALMAPELAAAKPGPFSVLDYRKSDAWSAGAIGYEIFGCKNPFYGSKGTKLDSVTYKEQDLPPLTNVSPVISHVISHLLKRSPSERLSASLAATLVQLYLWAPVTWFTSASASDSDDVVLECFIKLLFSRWHPAFSLVEKTLIEIFLTRVASPQIALGRQTIAAVLHPDGSSSASASAPPPIVGLPHPACTPSPM